MEFTNSFEVSLAPDQAWPWLMDVKAIVPCMPGAELLEKRDDGSFTGKISVRLGPVSLVFVCEAKFTDVDDVRHKARIVSCGSDAKGRGAANAQIGFSLQPSARGSKVLIDTQLELSGAVAQYGRGAGLIQNVANQIVSQFARNLEARITQLKEHAAQTGQDALTLGVAAGPGATDLAGDAAAITTGHSAPGRQAAGSAEGAVANATQSYVEGFKAGFCAGHAAGYQAALQAVEHAGGIPAAPSVAGLAKSANRGLPPFPKAKPINGLALFFSSFGHTIAGWFSRRPR